MLARFTKQAQIALELAKKAAIELGHGYVGTEHILIGILSEEDNYAIRFLSESGVDIAIITTEALNASGINPQNTVDSDVLRSDKASSQNGENL